MQSGLATRGAAERVWALKLEAKLTGGGQSGFTADRLELMVELMMRTSGVRSAAVTVEEGSTALGVWVSLAVGTAEDALRRAMALVSACAQYAGIRGLAVKDGRVVEEPSPSSQT